MPIVVDSEIDIFSKDEFHTISNQFMGIVFDVHNSFGRLMDEWVYKNVICRRCEAAGIIPVRREVKIIVTYQEFVKEYYMDLLCANGLMAEVKTVERLSPTHIAQALNYLILAGLKDGLLINLRHGKVEKRFVSTTLDLARRRQFAIDDSKWISVNVAGERFRQAFIDLISDWGGFLKNSLYREAMIHLLGGPETVLQKIPIYDRTFEVGTHEVCLLSDGTAFAITGLKDELPAMQSHLQRFLSHTTLQSIQWVNMNNHDITFHTIGR